MLLTILTMLAFALAFAYLLVSVGAQYPNRNPQQAGRPDEEERQIRRGGLAGATPSVIARRAAAAQRRPWRRRSDAPVTAAIVDVDRGLAHVLIVEARDSGGDRRLIDRATRAFERGNRLAAEGSYERAAAAYATAWSRAGDALRRTR